MITLRDWYVLPSSDVMVKGRFLKSTDTMSSVMMRVPKMTACWRISSISSGPWMPCTGWGLSACTQ